VNIIDGPTKLVRQDAILGGLSIGQMAAQQFLTSVSSVCILGREVGREQKN